MPTDVCAGSTQYVSIGHDENSTVYLCRAPTTLGHNERIFLPDGVECGENGCSYISSVNFTSFAPGEQVTSSEDINYVRLNIEHSYLGDIYIAITCPSNQTAVLMNWSGAGHSPCTPTVPEGHRTWSSGTNASHGSYLGAALDDENSRYKCDSTAEGNEPGEGWNYCWSNSTRAGISYAPGDALIYRSANVPPYPNHSVDSSNVVARTNFYHPDQDFSSLVGCPLNGNWSIEVIDAYSIDNGYIFGWDISLYSSQELIHGCQVVTRNLDGPYAQRLSDSLFRIDYPADITADTTVAYTFSVVNTCGDTIDSTLYVTIHPNYSLDLYDTICAADWDEGRTPQWSTHSVTFGGSQRTATGDYPLALHTRAGCDSTVTLHLTVHPVYDLHIHDTIFNSETRLFEGNEYEATGTYPAPLTTYQGCDSLRTLHLVHRYRGGIDTIVCQSDLPFVWLGAARFNEGQGLRRGDLQLMRDSVQLWATNGDDSLVVLTLAVRDTAASTEVVHSCDSLIWHHLPDTVLRSSTTELLFRTPHTAPPDTAGLAASLPPHLREAFVQCLAAGIPQCDSAIHLDLRIVYQNQTIERLLACDSLVWPTSPLSRMPKQIYYRDTVTILGPLGSGLAVGPVDSLLNIGGCDSVIALDLRVHHATYQEEVDTFCFAQYYTWRGQTAGNPDPWLREHTDFTLTETLQSHTYRHPSDSTLTLTCDSTLAIHLTQMARPSLTLVDSISCGDEQYTLVMRTNAPYLKWIDTVADREVEDTVIYATPRYPSRYTAYVDYRIKPFCPLTDSLRLLPIVKPHAQLEVNPDALTYANLDLTAYDNTPELPRSTHVGAPRVWERQWFIDGEQQGEEDRILFRSVPHTADSVALMLAVYNGQCRDTIGRVIPVLRTALFAPTAFTPLQAPNDRFRIVGHGILWGDLYIYNREGLLVYHSTDLEEGWDGTSHGRECPQGSYVWRLFYRGEDLPSSTKEMSGSVLLLR